MAEVAAEKRAAEVVTEAGQMAEREQAAEPAAGVALEVTVVGEPVEAAVKMEVAERGIRWDEHVHGGAGGMRLLEV